MSDIALQHYTKFLRIGGTDAVSRLVEAFYLRMDTLPELAELRAIHRADLTGTKEVLVRYLGEWLGGPALYSAERSARLHGIYPRKGTIKLGSDCDLVVLERGDFVFDEADIQDRPEMRWSPYHGRRMRARVAATVLRGKTIWNGSEVLAKPGTGVFVRRQNT